MADKPSVWLIGVEHGVKKALEAVFTNANVTEFGPTEFEKLMNDGPADGSNPCLVICGPEIQNPPPAEMAQLLRSFFQDNSIFYVKEARPDYDRAVFKKNGFTDVFSMLIDQSVLLGQVKQALARSIGVKAYRAVKLIDVDQDTVLEFDTSIYMPANNKYVTLSRAGETIDAAKAEKLKKHKINSLHVPMEQVQKFYDYTAKKLKDIGSSETMSQTEKSERLQMAVRDLLSGVLTDTGREGSIGEGKALIENCQKIVSSYILDTNSSQWYERIQQTASDVDKDSYNHASNVSTYAALFAMGLGKSNPEYLALAGMLHDLGMVSFPELNQHKDEEHMTDAEKNAYYKHVEETMNVIKTRKLVLPEVVTKAIYQHHERFNGTGFPKKLVGAKISIEAQILAIADKFDHLTSVCPGRARMTPREAIEYMHKQVTGDPGRMHYDPQLLAQILKLFPETE